MVLVVAVATGFSGGLLAMFLTNKYQYFLYAGPWGDEEVRAYPSLGWVTVSLIVMTIWMVTAACSRMHHWLMPGQRTIGLRDAEGHVSEG